MNAAQWEKEVMQEYFTDPKYPSYLKLRITYDWKTISEIREAIIAETQEYGGIIGRICDQCGQEITTQEPRKTK